MQAVPFVNRSLGLVLGRDESVKERELVDWLVSKVTRVSLSVDYRLRDRRSPSLYQTLAKRHVGWFLDFGTLTVRKSEIV